MQIVLWGATGQAKVLRELLDREGTAVVAVFDHAARPAPFADVPLFVGRDTLAAWASARDVTKLRGLAAIGGDRGRDRLAMQAVLASFDIAAYTAIHRTAFVAGNARIGAGSQILAQAAVCAEATLGMACIVNTAASVDHECVLGDGVHVAPGARLAGLVTVGDCAMIGTGAVVLPRVAIGAGAIVGAGAVVTRDVPAGSTVVGNPARARR